MDDKYLKQKADPERRKKLLQEKQDRMIADLRKRETTSINQQPNPDSDVKRVAGGTDKIDTKSIQKQLSGGDFKSKIADLLQSRAAKKAMGILPLAGAGMAALSGDPAMAAEELAQDAMGPAGLALEAIRPSDSGNPEEERMMLAEDKARKNYNKSPARMDRLKALMGREPASVVQESQVKEPLPRMNEQLQLNKIPHLGAEGLESDEIAPDMEKTLQGELKGAEEITPEGMRAIRLKRLLGLKG